MSTAPSNWATRSMMAASPSRRWIATFVSRRNGMSDLGPLRKLARVADLDARWNWQPPQARDHVRDRPRRRVDREHVARPDEDKLDVRAECHVFGKPKGFAVAAAEGSGSGDGHMVPADWIYTYIRHFFSFGKVRSVVVVKVLPSVRTVTVPT